MATLTVGHLALQVFGTLDDEGFSFKDTGKLAATTSVLIWPADGGVTWPPRDKFAATAGVLVWADSLLTP